MSLTILDNITKADVLGAIVAFAQPGVVHDFGDSTITMVDPPGAAFLVWLRAAADAMPTFAPSRVLMLGNGNQAACDP